MKIQANDYIRLKNLVIKTKEEFDIKPRQDYGVTIIRYVWDIYHLTLDWLQRSEQTEDYLFVRSLYDYLNEDHLTTALKKILCQ